MGVKVQVGLGRLGRLRATTRPWLICNKGAFVAVTPHGFLPRDSHEISPTIGGGTQVDDFTKGICKGNNTTYSAKKWAGVRETQTPLCFVTTPKLLRTLSWI